MPYQWQYAKPGVGKPVPNFAHPLWRGCLFAATVGSSRGHQVIAGPDFQGDTNDRFGANPGATGTATGQRATVFEAGGFTPNNACWQVGPGGLGFDNGDGVTSLNVQGWNDQLPPTIPGVGTGFRYDLPQIGGGVPLIGATWAVIIRPDLQLADPLVPFFKRRAQPYGAAQGGWHFSGAAGNLWRFQIADGVATTFTRTSTTVQDPIGQRADLLVARYAAVPGSATNSRLELWVNGIAEAGVAGAPSFATVPIPNPAGEDIKILGYSAANSSFPGWIPFAAFWARPLAGSELNQLHADPYRMWRWLTADQALIGESSPGRLTSDAAARGLIGNPINAPGIIGAAGLDGGCCCCAAASSLLF